MTIWQSFAPNPNLNLISDRRTTPDVQKGVHEGTDGAIRTGVRLVNDFIEELQDQVHILDFNHLVGFLSASVTQRDSLHPNEHYMQYMIQLVSRWINAINATLGLANASDYKQPDLQTRMTECIDYARASLPPPVPTPTASPTDAPSPLAPGTCACDNPSSSGATLGNNRYTCADGTRAYCASNEECYATKAFQKGDWASGCRVAEPGVPNPSPTETPTPIITPAPTLPQTDLVFDHHWMAPTASPTNPIPSPTAFSTLSPITNPTAVSIQSAPTPTEAFNHQGPNQPERSSVPPSATTYQPDTGELAPPQYIPLD